ncbi:MAG TPA: signal peptidase I [Candidatus Limnocylindrales bacterium]|nr:signal peptidase I [Candidatus Limnocylindrales bacterium]
MIEPEPRPMAGLPRVAARRRSAARTDRFRGPWRVAVSEHSMSPAIQPGDWLLVDPTTTRWPRRGTVVVFREPDSQLLAIKRVAARPGDRVELDAGHLVLRDDEAWLLSDAPLAELTALGAGAPIDSRRYGPVPVELLVGRVWLRYWPVRRLGLIAPG